MRLELTGRHIRITPALRQLVEDGLQKLERVFHDGAVSLQAVLSQEKHRHHVEMTLHARGEHFFHSGISSSYGDAVSSVTIKNRIKKIIEGEDPKKPLSDSKIVTILQREGLVLARRTIAKYREELKIPTSNQRKVLY